MAVATKRAERARAARRVFRTLSNPELDRYAAARLDPLYGVSVVEDDPYAPDATYFGDGMIDTPPSSCPLRSDHATPRPCVRPNGHDGACDWMRSLTSRKTARKAEPAAVLAPAQMAVATDGASTIDPCPRCGRTDWQTVKGRKWHLDNNPACANFRQPEHTYITIGG